MINTEPWVEQANCIGTDPEAFFIEVSSKTSRTEINRFETAKSICHECPVAKECLEFAENNNLTGLFGGKYVKP